MQVSNKAQYYIKSLYHFTMILMAIETKYIQQSTIISGEMV